MNPFEFYDEGEFQQRFRFRKDTVIDLIEMLRNDIHPASRKGGAIPSHLQVLLALRFYATGQFQRVSGDLIGVDVSTASRIVKKVSFAIAGRKNQFIKFPDAADMASVKRDFYRMANFPGVIGAIDCTHIPVINPGGQDSARFVNRKGYYSVNTQVVCDAGMKVTNIVAKWPGATHDSRIFQNSRLCVQLENQPHHGHLLGDNGYACSNYLLTPLLRPQTAAEQRYNRSHKTTRGIIEHLFGLVKRRFHCLHIPLRTKLETSLVIIVAVFILHNIAVERNEPELDDSDTEDDDSDEVDGDAPPDRRRGNAYRNNVIQQHFSN